MKEFLKGKKSYIVAVLGVVVNGCSAMGYIDASTVGVINTVLVSLFGITIRAGIGKK